MSYADYLIWKHRRELWRKRQRAMEPDTSQMTSTKTGPAQYVKGAYRAYSVTKGRPSSARHGRRFPRG